MTIRQLRILRHRRILHLDGREWCTAGFVPGDPGAAWAWASEAVAAELSCNVDDVGLIETDEGDTITVEGMPVYILC